MGVSDSNVMVLFTLLSGSKPEMRQVLVRIDKWKGTFYLSFSSLRWLSVSLSRDGIVRRVGLTNKTGSGFSSLTPTSALSAGNKASWWWKAYIQSLPLPGRMTGKACNWDMEHSSFFPFCGLLQERTVLPLLVLLLSGMSIRQRLSYCEPS